MSETPPPGATADWTVPQHWERYTTAEHALWELRHAAFERAAETGNGVVAAIERFKHDNGDYPDDLGELVPKYLTQVPGTGLMGYQDYYYWKQGDATDRIKIDAAYKLEIDCPFGLNFDVFFYWPNLGHPERIYGGVVEPIGNWAYVHE